MTIKAVTLAEADGRLTTGATAVYQRGLRAAFFEQNRNIAQRRTQLELHPRSPSSSRVR